MDEKNNKGKIDFFLISLISLTVLIVATMFFYQIKLSNLPINWQQSASIFQQLYPQAKIYQAQGTMAVYLVMEEKKRPIVSEASFEQMGFAWDDLEIVSQQTLDEIESVTLIKSDNNDKVYYLTPGGYKYLLKSAQSFDRDIYIKQDIVVLKDREIASYPDTYLIKLSGDDRIFLIDGSVKRWISEPMLFKAMYSWDMVVTTSRADFDSYQEGEPIKAALWTDKEAVRPLDEIEVHFSLPQLSLATIKIRDGQGEVYEQVDYDKPVKEGLVKIRVGKALGKHEASIEIKENIIVPTAQFMVQAETEIISNNEKLNGFYDQVQDWMANDITYCEGAKGYRSPDTKPIWIRDHTHQSKGFKYWEEDMTSIIDWFLDHQFVNGLVFDYCPGGRIEVEADVEYMTVLAVYTAWQATGDDLWMYSTLEQLEDALRYSMSDERRWDMDHLLIKRAFTIDTWDFQWFNASTLLTQDTPFGLMSGDNSGAYAASIALAKMFTFRGDAVKELHWTLMAALIKERANKYLWDEENGYYMSYLHLDEVTPKVEIDESQILSLSNVYNLNREDFVSQQQAKRIIEAYQSRADSATWQGIPVFQEWFSIYPDYGNDKWGTPSADKSGEYVNGGIMPLVGGELSRAAFEHGFESYGLQEILQYIELTRRQGNKTYLWYWPNGEPGISGRDTLATDGWGSSAFLSAYIEGLAGVVDLDRLYKIVRVSPRWPVAETKDVKAVIKYGSSQGYFAYDWHLDEAKHNIIIEYTGSGDKAIFHVLMPEGGQPTSVSLVGKDIVFETSQIEQSLYVDFSAATKGVSQVVINYE